MFFVCTFQITNKKDFYTWLNTTFIPTYYPVNNYASKPLTDNEDNHWFKDMASIRVGPARLRQVRMKSGTITKTTRNHILFQRYYYLF